MLIGYYLIVILVLAVAGPVLLMSKKARAGLSQKLGFLPAQLRGLTKSSSSTKRAWFHAVSVGEFNALFALLEKFKQKHPEYELFVSTTTATGQALAQTKAGSFATVFYFPFDLPFATNSLLKAIKPNFVGIVETEIWPGFMNQCYKKEIPVLLINGRLSPRSYESYLRWKWFFGEVIQKFAALAVQSDAEAQRFQSFSNESSESQLNIAVTGNIKLDGLKAISEQERNNLRQKLKLKDTELVIVAGSTHEEEEAALLEAIKQLNTPVRLILVPRHPERFERVASIIESYGFSAKRFSKGESLEKENDVYLLDTIGQLQNFYSIADLAFVGGTLVPIGGHNLAEPCIYKVPVLCGPYVHKTKDIADCMLKEQALLLAADKAQLLEHISELANSKTKRDDLGNAGFQWLSQSQGATERTLTIIESVLDNKNCPELRRQKNVLA